jgi:hypothetical protein
MKNLRHVCLILAGAGFIVSLGIHVCALVGRAPSSGEWLVFTFVGSMVVWVAAAVASGTRGGRMGAIPMSAIVEMRPSWLRATTYVCFVYAVLFFAWGAIRPSSFMRLGSVDDDLSGLFAMFSCFSMSFFVGAFSMAWGNVSSRDSQHESTPN